MSSCPNCQAPVGDRARFCGSCGAEIAVKPMAFSVDQAAPGTILKDRYKLMRALPARGSARREGSLLWEAQDTTTGGRIQLQLLPRVLTENPAHVTELKRLCELWQKTDHPAVVRLERLETDPVPFLVLEHVDAISFEELLASRRGREQGPFTAEELSTLLPPVGEALDKLGEKGLVHGAVEPGHLLVPDARFGPAARVTLPGVGALIRDVLAVTTPANGGGGSPRYTAPEQAPGQAPEQAPGQTGGRTDRRSDVYALGVTIAHLLSGKHPLAGGAADLTAVPAALRPPLERALASHPDGRPASAGILVRDLVDASRRLKEAPQVNVEQTVRMPPKGESPVTLKLSNLDGPARVGAPEARAALRAAPAPAAVTSPAPAPAAVTSSAAPEVEKTIRFVPGMMDASMGGGQPTPPAAKLPPPAPPPLPPPPVQKAAPPPPVQKPAPPAAPDFERTIRFVPGMTDDSQAAAAKQTPAPPPKPAPPPPPVQVAPPAPSVAPELERTIRFVPGMTDASLAAPTAQQAAPPAAAHAAHAPHSGGAAQAHDHNANAHGDAKPDKPAEPEGGAAILEWVLIIALGLIALWQIIKTLG